MDETELKAKLRKLSGPQQARMAAAAAIFMSDSLPASSRNDIISASFAMCETTSTIALLRGLFAAAREAKADGIPDAFERALEVTADEITNLGLKHCERFFTLCEMLPGYSEALAKRSPK